MSTIKYDAGADLWILCRRVQGERAAHAEPDGADFLARGRVESGKIISSGAQVSLGLIDAHRHHHLACLVRRLRRLAVIKIRSECDKTFRCKPVANFLDVVHQSPPFLNHNYARPTALLRFREIAAGSSA